MENKHKMSENRSKNTHREMEICHKVTKLSTKLEVEHPQSQKHGGAALQTER